MYPQAELTRLAAYKLALQRDITRRRAEYVAAVGRLTQPLAWLERAVAWWRRLAPVAQVAALPLGFVLQRVVFRRQKILGSIVRWSPLVFGAFRALRRGHPPNPRAKTDDEPSQPPLRPRQDFQANH